MRGGSSGMANQNTEPHSPWQNPAELNGAKYLKLHAQSGIG
jgi:hypothetical protein